MDTPQYYQFMNPTLQALRAGGGTLTNEEIVDAVSQRMQLPDEVMERQQTGHNVSEVEYRIAWAKSYLKQAGYLTQSTRGVWALTSTLCLRCHLMHLKGSVNASCGNVDLRK